MKKSKSLKLVRSLIASLLMAMMVVSLSAPEAMAKSSKTKTMTAYNQVVVNGSYAYCSANGGLYKVNLKTGEKKLFVQPYDSESGTAIDSMKLYKGYLYYIDGSDVNSLLHRIKLSGKNKKALGNVVSYAISNGKIYYKIRNKSEKIVKKSMKLNGSNKKKSRYNVKMKGRKSNKKGYYINQVLTHTDPHNNYEYYTDYLVTPSGKRIALSNYMINLSDL
ncbi:MAG: hypothetical protein IKG17_01485 [Mogibacterium sp.]|nr:hypothetical protein [Mogibacterium sp.]